MVQRKQLLCRVLLDKLKSHAFQDHQVTLRHPVDFLVTCLASRKTLTFCIYRALRKGDVTMEVKVVCPVLFLPERTMLLVALL